MKIRFFDKASGQDAPDLDFFVMRDGSVWQDNYETCESQSAVVGFDDFILSRPDIGWEVL